MAASNLTASPLVLNAQDDADTRNLFVTWVRWNGATTAGHLMQLTDTAGNVIFESVADGANFIDVQPVFKSCRGVKVPDLDSGKVYVFYR